MKKIAAIILALVLAAAFSVTAFAEEKITVLDGKMKVTVPEGFFAIWKDMTYSAEIFEYYDLTLEEALEILDDDEAYFFTEDFINEIYIFAYESEYLDFDLMDEESFAEYLAYSDEYYSADYECEVEKFETNGIRYAKSLCYDQQENISFAEYETIYGGINIFIRFYCWEGNLDLNMQATADMFIEDVVYEKRAATNPEPFVYEAENGTKFDIPAGWVVYEEENIVDIYPEEDYSVDILYTTVDLWQDFLTEDEKKTLARSSFSIEDLLDVLTPEEFFEIVDSAESFDFNSSEMGIIEIGGKKFITAEKQITDYLEENRKVKIYADVDMGILHLYVFAAADLEKYQPVFEDILINAEYKEIPDEGGEEAAKQEELHSKTVALLSAIRKVIKYAISFGVLRLIVKGILKKKKSSSKREEPVLEEPQTTDENPRRFCSECGAQVEEADKICPLCGAKIK